ncbi:MAG: prepilin-type N-terminal cleavage/methylation domain-containing protein [Candidatus Omnitrophica bacterium]|nr:hypothetical protein [bacterium]NUN97360.1 prepilin-type N-terminal cleavage/methylation domain-containing protein [Candidatus Omnitrophota bacterium]
MKRKSAFTLIELLIVIAIILILIAIALPNFLEAQIRSKVARAKSEMRSIDTAMAAYYLDFKIYPDDQERHQRGGLFWLTSPIKYMSDMPQDPFFAFDNGSAAAAADAHGYVTYELGGMEAGQGPGQGIYPKCHQCLVTWTIFSPGPDGDEEPFDQDSPHYGGNNRTYTPTNGTRSNGNIVLWGGDSAYIGMRMDSARPDLLNAPHLRDPVILDNQPYFKRLPPSR